MHTDSSKSKCGFNDDIAVTFKNENEIEVQFKPEIINFDSSTDCPVNRSDVCIFQKGDLPPILSPEVTDPNICPKISYSRS